MLVQEEHGDTGDVDEFVDLPPTGAVGRGRVAVGGGLTDAVGLVADQDIEAVPLCGHEAVEVLEQLLHLSLAGTRNLPHRLGERLGASGVQGRNALPVQLAEQGKRDDALAGAGPAGDNHDLLVVGPLRLAHSIEHTSVRDLLFVEKDELLTFTYL